MKLVEIAWYIKCFVFNNLEFLFCEYVRMENPNDKSENIKRKYWNNMENNQFLKVKNSLLELEKDFIKSKDKELKDREVKIKREMEELLLKPFIVFIYDTDKLEQEGRKKIRPIKNTYD